MAAPDDLAVDASVGPPPGVLTGAVLIAVVTIAARVAGFARVLVFARTVGPTCLGDVYTTANTIPNIVFDIVAGGALSSLVVPTVAGRVAAGDEAAAKQIVGALLSWIVVLLIPVSIIGGLLAGPLMRALIGGGHGGCSRAAEVSLGAQMLRIFAPQILLYGVGVVLTGSLQARRRFLMAALAPLLSSAVVLVTYLLYDSASHRNGLSTHLHVDTTILAVGTTLGVVALSVPLLVPALRGWRVPLSLTFPPGVGAVIARLAVAGAVVLGSQQLATAVVLRLANADGVAGSVVAYNLGWTVFLLPWAVLCVPVATSAFPVISAAWHAGDRDGYADVVASTTRLVAVLAALSGGVLIAAAVPAARVLILGAPGTLSTAVVARTLTAFAPGLVGYGLLAQLSRVRYARGDARGPAFATAIGWLLSIVIDVIGAPLVPSGWVPALLAAAASAGVTVAALILARPVLRDLAVRTIAVRRTAGAAVVAAAVAGVAGRVVAAVLPGGRVAVSLADTVVAGLVVVVVALIVLTALDRAVVGLMAERLRRDR